MNRPKRGTLIKVCLAVLSAAGFAVFLTPVFTYGFSTGNAAGILACSALLSLSVSQSKLQSFILEHKALKIISAAAVTVISLMLILAVIISALMISAAKSSPEGNIVIILGCKVKDNGPSNMLRSRIMTACGYLKEHPEAVCIASGGKGSDELISEAECIKRVLVENGISEDRIILEDSSSSTEENFRFSAEIMKERGLTGKTVVATSSFHQFRAGMIAEDCGLDTSPLSASAELYTLPSYWVREWFAICYYFIKS